MTFPAGRWIGVLTNRFIGGEPCSSGYVDYRVKVDANP
jgi:hypothetical protein